MMRLLNPLAIAQSIRAAYPRRYVKMVLLGEEHRHMTVMVALEADELIEGSKGFTAILDMLTPSMWQLQLERARAMAETGRQHG